MIPNGGLGVEQTRCNDKDGGLRSAIIEMARIGSFQFIPSSQPQVCGSYQRFLPFCVGCLMSKQVANAFVVSEDSNHSIPQNQVPSANVGRNFYRAGLGIASLSPMGLDASHLTSRSPPKESGFRKTRLATIKGGVLCVYRSHCPAA